MTMGSPFFRRGPSPAQLDAALAILRIVFGIIFVVHGWQKLFVFGFPGVIGAFTHMGVPLPGIVAPVVAILEFFGGLALVIGLLTRVVALLLAVEMSCAILIVHLPAGFFLPMGYEYPLILAASGFALALTGAGAYSADAALGKRPRA